MDFNLDTRLGIELPDLSTSFESLGLDEQEDVLYRWETIRARIPERIMKFEQVIEDILDAVHHEEDWDTIAAYFTEISDYASRIAELNTWRRVDQSLHHAPQSEFTSHPFAREHQAREK